MRTDSEQYQQHLLKKYHRGRGLYLRFCLYPKYLRALGDLRGREIVDLGCGSGEFLNYCQSRGIPALGVDSNEHLVAQCRSLGLEVILADILTYAPGEGKQLANLVCDNVVEHLSLEEIDRFFQNLKRIVAPGGKMLVVVPGKKGFRGIRPIRRSLPPR